MNTNRVAILGGKRTPFARSFAELSGSSNQDMLSHVLKSLVHQFSLEGVHLGEVALGALITHSSDWNIARESVLSSGLAPTTPANNIQRACATSLESIISIANKIALGQIQAGIGGGSDTNSDAPIVFSRDAAQKFIRLSRAKTMKEKLLIVSGFRPQDFIPVAPGVIEPRTGLSMGQHTELMVKEWNISREEQDLLSFASHMNASKAYSEHFYEDLVTPFKGYQKDLIIRDDTSLEKLAKLKPAFDRSSQGSLTAGNSTLLSDGAAAVFLSSEEYAKQHGHEILAYLKDSQSWGIDYLNGEGLLMAPTIAVGELLKRNDLKLQDFDFYEIHEAFAGQVLATLKAWESASYCKKHLNLNQALGPIDRDKMNVKGGSVAIGHPFAATGARVIATMAKILSNKGKGLGLVSICTAGGMGTAAIIERP